MGRTLEAIAKMDAHHRMLLGFIVAAVVGLSLHTHALWTASLATYDAFAFAILGLFDGHAHSPRADSSGGATTGCGAHSHFHLCYHCGVRRSFCGCISDPKRKTGGAAPVDSLVACSRHGGALMATHALRLRIALRPQIL
jgi:hypothetical protein